MVRKHIIEKEPSLTLKNEGEKISEIRGSHVLSEQSSLDREVPLFFPFSILFLSSYTHHIRNTSRNLREKHKA